MSKPVPRKRDTIGRNQYRRRTTLDERDRRDAIMVKLHKMGHNLMEISAALDISASMASERMVALGYKRDRAPGRGPVTIDCPWREEDMPPPTPAEQIPRWQRSTVVDMVQMLNDHWHEGSFANVLANQVQDALMAGDKAWVRQTIEQVTDALEKLERARRVLTDPHYRRECIDTHEGVEQLRHRHTSLRAIR